MSQQIGNIYRVSYWRKFETPQEYDEDKEYIEKNKPKAIIQKSTLEMMSMEEANEKLQKKITTERKSFVRQKSSFPDKPMILQSFSGIMPFRWTF